MSVQGILGGIPERGEVWPVSPRANCPRNYSVRLVAPVEDATTLVLDASLN